MSAARWTGRLALAGVSVIAAVASYFHALAVVRAAGGEPPVAYLVPFLADLVILGASAGLLDASRRGQRRPALATVALVAGIGVTLAMNIAAGWPHGIAGALVAGWPALAFILALESLAGLLRGSRNETKFQSFSDSASQGEPLSTEQALQLLLATGSRRVLAEALSVPKSRVDSWAARSAQVVPAAAEVQLNGSGPDGP